MGSHFGAYSHLGRLPSERVDDAVRQGFEKLVHHRGHYHRDGMGLFAGKSEYAGLALLPAHGGGAQRPLSASGLGRKAA